MNWRIKKPDQDEVDRLASELSVSRVVAWVLLNRGINDAVKAEEFLSPSLDNLKADTPPAGAEKAVERIAEALEKGETIGIHGDYDVDGITGTALLDRFLRELGGKTVSYLPHRQKEGYGMKPVGVEELHKRGAGLILSVDCGVNDYEAVERSNRLDTDVIVVDHHQLPETLPPAHAIVNPRLPDCPYNSEELSGAGVAFYLCIALRAHLRKLGRIKNGPNLKAYLDLVALGTIADVVPITGMNRVLVHFGLAELAAAQRPGIIQLKRVAGLSEGPVGVGQVSFRLAPRLNAMGRLDAADPALQLLLAENEREAGIIADKLEELNRTRQSVEERILEEADKALGVMEGGHLAPGLAVAGQGWHVGVIGIVASRLTDTYYRPSAVIGVHNGMGRGSLRSIPGVNIYKVLERCSHLLEVFGGHPSAAGLTIKEDNIPRFLELFPEAVAAQAPDLDYEPYLSVDAEWPVSNCDLELVKDLGRLKPHGIGNPEPCFCARGVLVKWARQGRSNTLLMGVEEKEVTLPAVGFRMGHRLPEPGDRLDIVYIPKLNTWKGDESVQLEIKDLRVLA